MPFADDIKKPSGQLKRFNESVTDPKCLLKIERTSFCNLAYLFRLATKFRCRLNLTMSTGLFDLFALFLRRDIVIICLQRFDSY